MNTYNVDVLVRNANSQGKFEWKNFKVMAPENADHETVVKEWQNQFSHNTPTNYEMNAVKVLGYWS